MKNYILMIIMLLAFTANAQEPIKPLKVGDKVRESFWQQEHTIYQNGKTIKQNLSAYKGKLLILDFWATWCSPCVKMFPKMDSLKRVFGERMDFLSITNQGSEQIGPFLGRLFGREDNGFMSVINDELLRAYFPYKEIPHYVWINEKGVVSNITRAEQITYDNIRSQFAEKGSLLSQKRDLIIPYDKTKPLFIDGNGSNGTVVKFQSILSNYVDGIGAGYQFTAHDLLVGRKVTGRNLSIALLHGLAFGKGKDYLNKKRWITQVKNPNLLFAPETATEFIAWKYDNSYCYELIVPPNHSEDIFGLMKDQLAILFPEYRVSVEKVPTKCLVLERTSLVDKLASKGGEPIVQFSYLHSKLRNTSLARLPLQLDMIYLQKYPIPVVDGTGYKGMVDLDIEANLSSVEAINKALSRYDLRLVEKISIVDMLVFNDSNHEN